MSNLFASLPPMRAMSDVFDDRLYQPVPSDWIAISTDVQGSTQAVEQGRQKEVNFIGASAIAALKNACAPDDIAFQFGGDGAMALAPPARFEQARRVLARARGFARREYGLTLRVGAAPVSAVEDLGGRILVGRYEPSPGNAFGMFEGGGMDILEQAVKGRGDSGLARLCAIPEDLDDGEPPDLTGLSCRVAPLQSVRGQVIALLVQGEIDHGELYHDLCRLTDSVESGLRAAFPANIRHGWTMAGAVMEAKARKGRGFLALTALRVVIECMVARLIFRFMLRVGRFDPHRYVRELATNTDFVRHDDTVAAVFDCPSERVEAVVAYLDGRERRGELRYGIQISDVAVMTCLVANPMENRHVHFMDGGGGGYTMASKRLKAAAPR